MTLMAPRAHIARIQQLLTSLQESIVDKPPYISGTIQLPKSLFSLFYKDGEVARHINLANTTPDELEQLTRACEPASFGMKQENVLDEAYRKAGKMDSECFAPTLNLFHTDLIKIIRDYLLEGTQSTKSIKAELYKLNVYGKGSFFKPHVDTPRSDKMFGSLVVVFPPRHKGGALLLRHRDHEWTFDSGEALAAEDQPSIGYVAFFSDIEHEVAPVISGHRITMTYNLYFDDDRPVVKADSEHITAPELANKNAFREAFAALVENSEFMPDGGTLAFGLRHVYQIKDDLKHVYSILKGSDALVYQSVRRLGYEPVLYMYYQNWHTGALIDKVVHFPNEQYEEDVVGIVCREGGFPVVKRGLVEKGKKRAWPVIDPEFGTPEEVEWATPVTEFNRQKDAFLHYGNDATLHWVYGDVCLVVRIGKAGERLAYPTVVELNERRTRREVEY